MGLVFCFVWFGWGFCCCCFSVVNLLTAFDRIYENSGLYHQLDLVSWHSCILYQMRICLSIWNKFITWSSFAIRFGLKIVKLE